MKNFDWSLEWVAKLHRYFEAGLSASQIAAEMGIDSRNAVVGKLHRLGLKRGYSVVPAKPRPRRTTPFRPPAVLAPPPPKTAPAPAPASPQGHPIALLDLTNETCRWPVTENPPHRFCGRLEADFAKGVPYCRRHSRMAYRRPGDVEAA